MMPAWPRQPQFAPHRLDVVLYYSDLGFVSHHLELLWSNYLQPVCLIIQSARSAASVLEQRIFGPI